MTRTYHDASQMLATVQAAADERDRAVARRARRWRIARRAVVAAGFGAALALMTVPESAWPQETGERWRAEIGGSTVTLRPTEAPGAVAEIFFDNRGNDTGGRIVHFFNLGPHHVEAELGDVAPDTILVTPADGYFAVPDTVTIPDGQTAVILIYRLEGVGM